MIQTAESTRRALDAEQPSRLAPVVARGLTKIFKDFWGRPKARAVDDISFEVREGEVFGLLGPNGSGKSTTVKMILGLLYPTKGHIALYGRSPRNVAVKSRVGYLPEESYLYRYLNGRETLDFFGKLFGLEGAERSRRIDQLLEMVGLGQTLTRPVGEFSKGMQRRIGLAQALINDPDLVILDEPTAGLDPIGCREVKDLILTLARRGKTVILSSHLLSDVEDVCDRVAILYGGRIQAMGALKELLQQPDALRITVPTLRRETLQRVIEIIRADVAEEKVQIDTPTQNLERYFLDVVQKAKATAETSGAVTGGRVAEYLRGELEPKPSADKILERLTSAAQRDVPAPAPIAEPEPAVDKARLEALRQPRQAETEAAPAVPEEKPADLAKANEKLSSLLGKPK